jgi:hypothetical protein
MNRQLHFVSLKGILAILLMLGGISHTQAQSPKKLLANGYYEQAFVDATKKQNKKVKLKSKYTDVIYKSYELIYSKGTEVISSGVHDWHESYNALIRVLGFRRSAKHPGIYDNLKNMLYDENILGNLIVKFNNENEGDLNKALEFEQQKKYFKALDVYHQINARQNQAVPITTFNERLNLIDTEERIARANELIGDQYIEQAEKLLFDGTKENAKDAITLINKAKSHRPLDRDEEELLTLANLIIRDSWMQEAKVLLRTKTKRNGRLAYELINKTRGIKSLTTEEELLLQSAKELGMTNVRLFVNGEAPLHSIEELSGLLNKERSSSWITYYGKNADVSMDLTLSIVAPQPRVVLGDVRRRIEQRSKKVEYHENETDANGNTVKVKKTKNVTAMVVILSRTKSSHIDWKASLADKRDGKTVYSEGKESKIERVNEFASVESGDIMALPENIESDVSLDSQPFPTDKEMRDLVTQLYLKELNLFLRDKKDHLLNIDLVLE